MQIRVVRRVAYCAGGPLIFLENTRVAVEFARARFIGRSSKPSGNAVLTAAYNRRGRYVDKQTGRDYDFRDKPAVADHAMLLPAGAAEKFRRPSVLWNAAEAAEKRVDARVARELIISLPNNPEVSREQRFAMAKGFAEEQFVRFGVAVQVDIHAEDPNHPHAHLLITTRKVEGERLAAKKARDLDPPVRRGLNGKKFVTEDQRHRHMWAEFQNRYFRENGIPIRVDPTAIVPGVAVGPVRFRRPRSPVLAQNAELARQNRAAAKDPERIIEALTRNKATFTEREVTRLLHKAGLDKAEVAEMRKAVMAHSSLVPLYDPTTGDLAERYTTKAIRAQEAQVMADAAAIAASPHRAIAIQAPDWMHEDQKRAHDQALEAGGLKVIEGRAGTGKSATVGAIRTAHEAVGYRVVGLAPTGTTAADMRTREGFAEARTAHSWLFRLKNGRDTWSPKTVVIADEAAMSSTPIIAEVLEQAKAAGAKMILVGDDRQLGSIDRGGMFAEIAEAHKAAEITQVMRQREEWQRQASQDLAAGRYGAAVDALDKAGAIVWSDSLDAAVARLVGAWAQDSKAAPDQTRMVFAWTNADVDLLNQEIRAVRKGRGELGDKEFEFRTKHGQATFARGDRVQFTRSEFGLGIRNGEVGTVMAISASRMEAWTDGGRVLAWDPRAFDGFRLGYSGTIYKGQGASIDATYVLHTGHWRAPASYVGLTRQRQSVKLFVSTNVAANRQELAEQMGRPEQRNASLHWEADRKTAIQRAVEIGKQMQAQERADRLAKVQAPPRNAVEAMAREVVAGTKDYEELREQAWKAVADRQLSPEAKDRRVENMTKWALDRAMQREAVLREAMLREPRSTDEWARMIRDGTVNTEEAMKALMADKPLEQKQAATRALMEKIREHDAWWQKPASTPIEWGERIAAGRAGYEDAMKALTRGQKVPLEQWQATSRALMEAVRQHEGRAMDRSA